MAFVCCKESWDMKDDRSWAEEERRQKARRYKGKLSLVISFSHTHTHEGGKVDLMEDFSGSHTSKHRTEGQGGRREEAR